MLLNTYRRQRAQIKHSQRVKKKRPVLLIPGPFWRR